MDRLGWTAAVLAGALALGCGSSTEPNPSESTRPLKQPLSLYLGFAWSRATPESQGMCGSIRILGCTKTLQEVWNGISDSRYNTKRFTVIRNDKIIYDRGGTSAYHVYSASKAFLGAPTLVHAMSSCGVGLTDLAAPWLEHGEGARWGTDYPWTDITIENLATHTSGVCQYSNTSAVCRDEYPTWQKNFEKVRNGGTTNVYPNDLFTLIRAKAELNRNPGAAPGTVYEYTDVGHGLLNYVVQRACGRKLTDIYSLYIKQAGMGLPVNTPLVYTDDGQQFNHAFGIAKWKGLDGAAVLRLAARQGIWDNKNVEPVRYWHLLTKITGNIPAAADQGRGVIFANNSRNMWTQSADHRKLSLETFGHGGNYSNIFFTDPLTSTTVVRQGENNATGASFLTKNGCSPGWTGVSPSCTSGTDYSNNWNLSTEQPGPRIMVMEPLQEAFFFPPPFCRMISAGGSNVDNVSDVYTTPMDATTFDLVAEITVNPREGAGSSVPARIDFYKETGTAAPVLIGKGTLVPGSSPAQYRLTYSAESHGAVGEVQTYFAKCLAKSTQDATKKVPSNSQPVRVKRL